MHVENCVAQLIKLAQAKSAELKTNTTVQSISVNPDNTISVSTDQGNFKAARLIVTLGSWSNELLTGLELNVQVLRKSQFWFQIDRTDIKYQNGFPAFLIEIGDTCFYCMPEIDYLGMKVAEHSGGRVVESAASLDRSCDPDDLASAENFLREHFEFTRSPTCPSQRLHVFNVC